MKIEPQKDLGVNFVQSCMRRNQQTVSIIPILPREGIQGEGIKKKETLEAG